MSPTTKQSASCSHLLQQLNQLHNGLHSVFYSRICRVLSSGVRQLVDELVHLLAAFIALQRSVQRSSFNVVCQLINIVLSAMRRKIKVAAPSSNSAQGPVGVYTFAVGIGQR